LTFAFSYPIILTDASVQHNNGNHGGIVVEQIHWGWPEEDLEARESQILATPTKVFSDSGYRDLSSRGRERGEFLTDIDAMTDFILDGILCESKKR